jgi:uncharacterized membrane protein (UPF0127 family)
MYRVLCMIFPENHRQRLNGNNVVWRILIVGFIFLNITTAFAIEKCQLQFSNGVTLTHIPLANTDALRVQGLSGKRSAANGMFFVWPTFAHRAFWMRDTHIPLSIGFFDSQNKLFSIQEMKPNTDTLHHSIKPMRYALELPSGKFQRYRLSLGTHLEKIMCANTDAQ